MYQIRDLIQHWRRRCRDHKHCSLEAKMPMPTPVLAVSGNHAKPSIMLVKSKGMKERYLALRVSLHSPSELRVIIDLRTVRSVAVISSLWYCRWNRSSKNIISSLTCGLVAMTALEQGMWSVTIGTNTSIATVEAQSRSSRFAQRLQISRAIKKASRSKICLERSRIL